MEGFTFQKPLIDIAAFFVCQAGAGVMMHLFSKGSISLGICIPIAACFELLFVVCLFLTAHFAAASKARQEFEEYYSRTTEHLESQSRVSNATYDGRFVFVAVHSKPRRSHRVESKKSILRRVNAFVLNAGRQKAISNELPVFSVNEHPESKSATPMEQATYSKI